MTYGGLKDAPQFFPAATPRRESSRSPAKPRSAPKRGRSKPPCKYGPRGADGYCPKKPRSSRSSRSSSSSSEAGTYTVPKRQVPAERKPTKVERRVQQRLERAVETSAKRAATKALAKGASSKTGQSIASGAAALTGYLKSPVSKVLTAGSASAAGAIGLSIAAGLAAFGATTAILKAIKNAKERRQQAAYEAAQAYRTARLDAQQRIGRPLTVAENQELAAAFDLKNLMRKAGL